MISRLPAAHEEIQLSWLRAFLAVQTTRSFTAAARHVHRTQSRVSAQIAQLEHHLGVQLFVRRLPTHLTDAGREFLPYAQAVLRDVEAGAAAVSSRGGIVRGRVSVASYPGASALVLAPLVKRFCDRHPEARVDLSDALVRDPTAAVVHSDVDLAIQETQPTPVKHNVRIRPLFAEPIMCIAVGDRAARHAHATPRTFTGETVIMTGDVGAGAGHYSALLASTGAQPAREIVVGQPTTVTAFVDAGLGIGILPALAAHLMESSRVRILPIHAPGYSRDVAIISNPARQYPPVVTLFINELLDAPLHPSLTALPAT